MKKFMAVYMMPVAMAQKMMATSTPEQMKAGMDEWTKWANANKKSIVDLGMPLGKTKRVTGAGVQDATNDMSGYSIVEGESAEAVAMMFKNHPHLKMDGATVEVVEMVAIPGMGM